jgi:gamma-glutamyl hercynylcysteine S-oxide synthase
LVLKNYHLCVALTSLDGRSYNPQAMKDDKRITQKDVDEASVRLKSLFGLSPGRYLALLYALALIGMLFALLVLPGLRRNGAYYTFTLDPPDAAVYIDGSYRVSGSAPSFVLKGDHELLVAREGFIDSVIAFKAEGRVFGSLFFPRKESLSLSLASENAAAILQAGMKDYSAWSMAGAPSEAYQHPMALSDAARAWSGVLRTDPLTEPPTGFAGAALSYASNSAALRDALRASSIVLSGSAALTPLSLGRLVDRLSRELSQDPALLETLLPYLPAAAGSALKASAFYASYRDTLGALAPAPVPSGALSVAGHEFIMLPAGQYSLGGARGRLMAFGLARAETTVAQFKAFLAAEPSWTQTAMAERAARGLRDEARLGSLAEDGDDMPARFVTRADAQAYCDWLSAKAPSGYRFTLPSEAQWSYAAAAGAASEGVFLEPGRSGPEGVSSLAPDKAGFKGLFGNVWEWCADSYAFFPAAGARGRADWPSAEGVVRGGSWANQSGSVDLGSRGPMRPDTASAFLGFRVALVPVEE